MRNLKKIVITGASGFLGSHLVERLKGDKRYEVYALSSRSGELREKIGGNNIKYFHKDIVTSDLAREILKDAIIINCAYPRNSTGIAIADGLKYIQGVFESAVVNKAGAIINISSQSVYSQHRTKPATEETPLCLESSYAVGKYLVELMLESDCKGSVTRYTNLRMASLIGPGFDQRIVNRFVKQAYSGEVLHVVINDQRFGFLDIEDAVGAIISLIEREVILWRTLYTVGTGEGYSVKEIAESVKRVFEKLGLVFPEIDIKQDEKKGWTAVDYHQINMDTGFKPVYSLEKSIYRILTTFKI